MKTIHSLIKKVALILLVTGFGLASLPLAPVAAADISAEGEPPEAVLHSNERLETAWAHLQQVYYRQSTRLDRADEFIARIQTHIDQANASGEDTSVVQAALDAFSAVIPIARDAHQPGAEVIASHAGFDANGVVTDQTAAIETMRSLRQVIRSTREAMNGTGQALREALRAYRQVHHPSGETVPPNQ
jgi:hypothetical protein